MELEILVVLLSVLGLILGGSVLAFSSKPSDSRQHSRQTKRPSGVRDGLIIGAVASSFDDCGD